MIFGFKMRGNFKERFTPSRYCLRIHTGPVTLCALNCIARAFQFLRVVQTSTLERKVFPRLTDPYLCKPAHFETSSTMGQLPL